MNKKSNQILLLVLVGLVWAGVIYRFFDLSGGTETSYNMPAFIPPSQTEKPISQYVYQLNYADPFLRYVPSRETKYESTTDVRQEPRRTVVNETYPSISYLGQVKFGDRKLGLIKVNGQTYMAKKGDAIVDNYKVLKLEGNELKLQVKDSVWSLTFD